MKETLEQTLGRATINRETDTVTISQASYAMVINGLDGLATLARIYLDAMIMVEGPSPGEKKYSLRDVAEAFECVQAFPDRLESIKFLIEELYDQIPAPLHFQLNTMDENSKDE